MHVHAFRTLLPHLPCERARQRSRSAYMRTYQVPEYEAAILDIQGKEV